jgi:hypothetical protein
VTVILCFVDLFFFFLATPWLGASKTVRTLLNGDTMGLDLFLKHKEGVAYVVDVLDRWWFMLIALHS